MTNQPYHYLVSLALIACPQGGTFRLGQFEVKIHIGLTYKSSTETTIFDPRRRVYERAAYAVVTSPSNKQKYSAIIAI